MDEKRLLKQLTEIAKKEGYVLLPKSYYERLFNGFESLRRDLKRARDSRDKLKEKLKGEKKEPHNFVEDDLIAESSVSIKEASP